MNGQMNEGQIAEWIDGQMDIKIEMWISGWMGNGQRWMDECMSKWTNDDSWRGGWMNRRTDS